MKRNEIIKKLINEGFSQRTLINFNDKQLLSLANRMLGEETVMISKASPTFQKDLDTAKKSKKTIETYESKKPKSEVKETLKGNQKKLDKNHNGKIDSQDFKILKGKKSEVKEDSWDSKLVTTKFNKINTSKSRSLPKGNYDNMSMDDSQSGNSKDDFYKKLNKSKYNPKKRELETPDVPKTEMKESGKKWIQKAIHPSKKGSLKKALGVKKDETIPVTKLKTASKKTGKLGQRSRLALTLRKLNEYSDTQNWVNNVVENNYHTLTTKNEIMELIKTKLTESDIMGAEPATKPSPSTNPLPTVDPNRPKPQKPKRENPFEPGRQPKPKAKIPDFMKFSSIGIKLKD